MTASADLEVIYRRELPALQAALVRRTGSFELAEDLAHDAWLEALEHWAVPGPPANPGGWLMTTALRKAVDRARREQTGRSKLTQLASRPAEPPTDEDRLALVFGCCDPQLPVESQVALTLKAVCGLTTAEIAAAFLVSEATLAQRLTRSKRLLKERSIVFEIPDPDELGERLAAVLAVIYLVYNEGYLSSAAEVPQRRELRTDAVVLAGLVDRLMPTEPEAAALLALLHLHEARAHTRFDSEGRLVLLRDQDRSRWDRQLIDEASSRLRQALARRRPGPYQLHAAIAVLHAEATTYDETDWPQIQVLYDGLLSWQDNPVARLNRAIATWHVEGPAVALDEVEALADALQDYRLLHATRAALLDALGRTDEAARAQEAALSLATNVAERDLLARRLERG